MTLADLIASARAEDAIQSVLDDERIAQLRHWLSPQGDLRMIIAHAESLIPAIDGSERHQLQRIVSRWNRMIDSGRALPPATDELTALVSDVESWDVRLGAERDAIPTSVEMFPQGVADLIISVARDWQMMTAAIPRGPVDAVIPIGGLLRANVSRPAYAAHLLATGDVTAQMVIGLASERSTSAAEKQQARELSVPPATEQAALEFGMERAFGFNSRDWSRTHAPGMKQGPTKHGVALFAGSAPPSALSGQRATTGEAVTWLLTTSVMSAQASVLQITATHCWLAGHVAMLTRLPHGSGVQTVGLPPGFDAIVQRSPEEMGSQRYLQEMKSFVDALPAMRAWASSAGHRECPAFVSV